MYNAVFSDGEHSEILLTQFHCIFHMFDLLLDGIGFCQVYIRCSVDEAQKENSMRTATEGMTVSQSTISTMATKFEAPNLENHWEASSFILDQVNCHAINSM